MRRASTVLLAAVLALAGCGGGHKTWSQAAKSNGQHQYATAYGKAAHSPTFGLPPHRFGLRRPPLATGVTTFEMFDTVTVSTVPSNPFATAGYTSGFWPTFVSLRAAFPSAHTISIAVNVGHAADCLDVEPGDANPSQVVGWYRFDQSQGFHTPCFYSALFNGMQQTRANLANAGIPRSAYLLWDADWTYSAHLDAGYDATQWTDHSLGRNLDESTVSAAFLRIATPPYNPTPPPPPFNPHYELYPDSATPSTLGVLHERGTVERYDQLRKAAHPNVGELRWLERRLGALMWTVYHRAHDSKPPAWSSYNRVFRFRGLKARYEGQRVGS